MHESSLLEGLELIVKWKKKKNVSAMPQKTRRISNKTGMFTLSVFVQKNDRFLFEDGAVVGSSTSSHRRV